MTRTILIPVDGSENSERAFHYYCDEIMKDGDLLLLLHVQMPPHLPSAGGYETMSISTDSWASLLQEKIHHSKAVMDKFKQLCEERQVNHNLLTGTGGPGEVIVDHAKRYDVKLIIVGSRGLNTLRRTFLGSVSDYVIHHTHVPVLVTPPPEHPHQL